MSKIENSQFRYPWADKNRCDNCGGTIWQDTLHGCDCYLHFARREVELRNQKLNNVKEEIRAIRTITVCPTVTERCKKAMEIING